MKVYRCNFYDDANGLGQLVSWHPSRREAERALAGQRRDRGRSACGPEGVEAVEIPTDRKGLIEWLNQNLSSDNG